MSTAVTLIGLGPTGDAMTRALLAAGHLTDEHAVYSILGDIADEQRC